MNGPHAWHFQRFIIRIGLHLAIAHRAAPKHGIQHAGEIQIQAEQRLAGDHGGQIDILLRSANDLKLVNRLERHILRIGLACRFPGQFAVSGGLAAGTMLHQAVFGDE